MLQDDNDFVHTIGALASNRGLPVEIGFSRKARLMDSTLMKETLRRPRKGAYDEMLIVGRFFEKWVAVAFCGLFFEPRVARRFF